MSTRYRLAALCLLALTGAGPLSAAATEIDLSKPVSESLMPDRIYWAFDEGTDNGVFAGLVVDRSPSGYHGRFLSGGSHPAPSYGEGRFGKGAFFQGETPPIVREDGRVGTQRNPRIVWRIPDTPAAWDDSRLDLSGQSFTFGVWLRFHQIKEGEHQSVVLIHSGHPPEPSSWGLGLTKNARDEWTIRAAHAFSDSSTTVFGDGQWHHLGVNVDAENREVHFWVDGEPLGQPVPMAKEILPMEDPLKARLFCVGESLVGGFSTGFVGDMDEFFITSGIHPFKPVQ